ncbi:hypothetical protein [Nitratifractor sp.]
MKRTLLLLAVCSVALLAAKGHRHHRALNYQDRDMDGVIDRYDRCPNTPFFALVNKRGCMIKRLSAKESSKKHDPIAKTH